METKWDYIKHPQAEHMVLARRVEETMRICLGADDFLVLHSDDRVTGTLVDEHPEAIAALQKLAKVMREALGR